MKSKRPAMIAASADLCRTEARARWRPPASMGRAPTTCRSPAAAGAAPRPASNSVRPFSSSLLASWLVNPAEGGPAGAFSGGWIGGEAGASSEGLATEGVGMEKIRQSARLRAAAFSVPPIMRLTAAGRYGVLPEGAIASGPWSCRAILELPAQRVPGMHGQGLGCHRRRVKPWLNAIPLPALPGRKRTLANHAAWRESKSAPFGHTNVWHSRSKRTCEKVVFIPKGAEQLSA